MVVDWHDGMTTTFMVDDPEIKYLIRRGWSVAEILHSELGVIRFDPEYNNVEDTDRLILRLDKVAA